MNYAYNKHTGEKIYLSHGMFCFRRMGCKDLGDALAKGWTFGSEDYEEPKGYWYYDTTVNRPDFIENHNVSDEDKKLDTQIGNYFETEEETEKAVEKLKAWKRLKDKGFEFESWFGGSKDISFWLDTEIDEDIAKDLELLFGGEE